MKTIMLVLVMAVVIASSAMGKGDMRRDLTRDSNGAVQVDKGDVRRTGVPKGPIHDFFVRLFGGLR